MATDDRLRDLLREVGLRATSARVHALKVLRGADKPLSHAEVFEAVADEGFDRATVYRNLMDLVEVGLAARRDLGDHVWRFELKDDEEHEHAHFICTECGTVDCLPDDAVNVQGVAHVTDVRVRGVCDTCA
ncbi:MAG TPA: transcriptional repressor [Polyangiaceae bacterium LLY-WYZ-15_(1-7)]|nr:Fur family transcriptional regulator [Myxococcales bacterium]MAT24352.1 Fur family transcriptional regulator [Sandaracinus sp.]HJK90154.1 transcriptional repressor [Polyangiaceae bacterium LLY-WYZ-15_(1-7)]HJL02922.1 transcriptional repressor [Polyangiaceae bacterium LLY-WYZ-15_(1-7)]HJL10305.1 transcriptional repressor [Polyangiaceae bacterium LLY-WYZ-15_(1-7)]